MKSTGKKDLSMNKLLKLQQAKDYLDNIIDSSLDSTVISDPMGYITRANESFLKMSGYKEKEIIGKHITEFSVTKEGTYESTSGELIEIDKTYFDTARDTIYKNLFEKGKVFGWEMYILHKNGKVIAGEENIVLMYDKKGEVIGAVGIIRDITERKKAEAELKKSEEKYQNLIEHANDAIVSINQKGEIIEFNEKAEKLFGYTREEILGKPSYFLAPQQYRERQKKILKEYGKTGGILSLDKKIFEGEGLRKDGQEFPAEFSYYVLELHGETIATAIIRDISERKEAEKKVVEYHKRLKSLTSQTTLNEEKERKRLADYLHDQIGQELFAIKIKLELLKDSLSSNKDLKILSDLSNSLIHTIDNTRSLTFELSPPILYQLGLEAALEWLAEHTYVQYNIVVSFEDDEQEKPLDEDVKIFLYQAVRELLTNVAKHAQTQNAKVSIEKDNTNIRICVEDNGVGFIPSSKHSSKNKGFGLFSIRERLDQHDGHLEIKSRDGRGTRTTLTVPLKNKRKS